MPLTGQATLKSPALCARLFALLDELKAHGGRVWLEGMSVRFDLPEKELAWVKAGGLRTLFERYGDVVVWLPAQAEMELEGTPHAEAPPLPQWRPFAVKRSPNASGMRK